MTGADRRMDRTHPQIWTIGHWTCPQEVFIGLLESADIELVVDVRALPGSRRSPHFDQEAMRGWLATAGIAYQHLTELSGRRPKQPNADDSNAGWQNLSFRHYADYTLTQPYEDGIAKLVELATTRRTTLLCGEPMPWRCHRLLISNTLTARGWTVQHIVGDRKQRAHVLGAWGAAPLIGENLTLTYPAPVDPTVDPTVNLTAQPD